MSVSEHEAPGMPPVRTVVVAYGDPEPLGRALGALGHDDGVVVVDNSSSAATRAVAEDAGAQYVDAGSNLGFAAAVNVALARLPLDRCDVLLLNPDALVAPDVVEHLRRALHAAPDVACAAPAQRRPGGERPSPVQWPFPTATRAWAEAVGLGRAVRRQGYVIASVLLVRGDAWLDVGGFDEGFFLYAEEADWERRAVRRGWRVAYCPEVTALHVGAGTDPDPGRRHVRFHAGVETYMRKWHGAAGWHSYQLATVVTAVRRAVVQRGRARRRAALELAHLYAAGPRRAARRAGVLPDRRHHVPAFETPAPS